MMKLESAVYLYQLTKDEHYRSFFDAHYQSAHLIANGNYASPFGAGASQRCSITRPLEGATDSSKSAILKSYAAGMNGNDNFKAHEGNRDPYLAYMKDYTWGSNSTKSNQGSMFYDMLTFGVDPSKDLDSRRAAERYVHYIHGAEPARLRLPVEHVRLRSDDRSNHVLSYLVFARQRAVGRRSASRSMDRPRAF